MITEYRNWSLLSRLHAELNNTTLTVVVNLILYVTCTGADFSLSQSAVQSVSQHQFNVSEIRLMSVSLRETDIFVRSSWRQNLETCIRNSETRRLVARRATTGELENSAILKRRQESWLRFCIVSWFLFWSRRRTTTHRPGRVLTFDK